MGLRGLFWGWRRGARGLERRANDMGTALIWERRDVQDGMGIARSLNWRKDLDQTTGRFSRPEMERQMTTTTR